MGWQSTEPTPRFHEVVWFPNGETLDAAVRVLMDCEHGHWFLVQKDENRMWVNPAGVACLVREGVILG